MERVPAIRPLLASLLAIGLVGCAHPTSAPVVDPGIELPGFQAGPVSSLSLEQVAADARDPVELAGLLEAYGFTGATVRAYSAGVGGPIRTVRVEVISFEEQSGAEAYLGWLHEHATDLVGDVQPESSEHLPVAFVLSHVPTGCCSKEQPVWLTAWRSQNVAVWVQVIGPDVRRERFGQLVGRLQGSA